MLPMRFEKDKTESGLNPNSLDPSIAIKSESEPSRSGDIDCEETIKKSSLNLNANNNSWPEQNSESPPTGILNKLPRLGLDYKQEFAARDPSIVTNSKSESKPLDNFELHKYQAMQLAYLQQQQASLKNGISSLNPVDETAVKSSIAGAVAAAAASSINNENNLPSQMQMLLSQQLLNFPQMQALMQQHALSSQQQQAQQLQDLYKQQLQEFQLQLAAAKIQQKPENSALSGSEENSRLTNGVNSKLTKDEQQIQQSAFRQLLQLQQQQQQHQHQAAAAAVFQQQGLAAAVALAQQNQQNFSSPDVTAELQQILLNQVGDDNLRKESPLSHSLSGTVPTGTNIVSTMNNISSNNDVMKENKRRLSTANRSSREGSPDAGSSSVPPQALFARGLCKWPGCDTECADSSHFQRHLTECHRLDDKTTAQYRVQMQIVDQLEKQLTREKERLDAMSNHLTKIEERLSRNDVSLAEIQSQPKQNHQGIRTSSSSSLQLSGSGKFPNVCHHFPAPNNNQLPHSSNHSLPSSPVSAPHVGMFPLSMFDHSSSPPPVSTSSRDAILHHVGKRRTSGNAPISSELSQNQEFYRNADVRPPFTYASLIRQAIIETPDCQMTLNEIYNWFQKKFAYFRRNAPTWKSAIRTNLSLHKCFKRCEDVMGSYWTVDDREFRKGRHLKRGRPRKYEEKELRPQSPSIRTRSDSSPNQGFYGAPMNLAALQMMFNDSSQFANQAAQAMLASQLPNYNFLQNKFPGMGQNRVSLESNGEYSSSNLTSSTKRSDSPSESKQQEETVTSDCFQKNSGSEFKKESMDIKMETPNDSEEKRLISPRVKEDDGEEMGGRESAPSETSTEGPDLQQNLDFSNGLLRQNVMSARGSFAMLHDHNGED